MALQNGCRSTSEGGSTVLCVFLYKLLSQDCLCWGSEGSSTVAGGSVLCFPIPNKVMLLSLRLRFSNLKNMLGYRVSQPLSIEQPLLGIYSGILEMPIMNPIPTQHHLLKVKLAMTFCPPIYATHPHSHIALPPWNSHETLMLKKIGKSFAKTMCRRFAQKVFR